MRGILGQILGGLAIGLALGLLIAWVIAPVEYTNTSPSSLRAEFKDQYRSAIASAFNSTGNLDRARARLALLADSNPQQALVAQAERMLASGDSPEQAFEISLLVNAINLSSAPQSAASETPSVNPGQDFDPTATQTPFGLITTPRASPISEDTPTPRATSTQKSTPTVTPTLGLPFILISREEMCDPDKKPGLLMVEVRNKKRQPIPGVELVVSWNGGEESFFTGLKPEISDGYADFEMSLDMEYSLHIATGGEPVPGLTAFICTNDSGEEYPGSIELIFQQP